MTRAKPTTKPAPPPPLIAKKLRSELPLRRLRSQISPIVSSNKSSNASHRRTSTFAASSCNSRRVSDDTKISTRSSTRKRNFGEVRAFNEEFRRVTRSYYKQKLIERKCEAEVSESSCVESNSGVDAGGFGEKSLNSNKVVEENEGSAAVTRSEVSCVEQSSHGILKSDAVNVKTTSKFEEEAVVSVANSADASCSEVNFSKLLEKTIQEGENRAQGVDFSEVSRNCADSVSNSESTTDQNSKSFKFASDLTCTEELSYSDSSEYSSETAFSMLRSEYFQEYSDLDFSDCSSVFESGSEFSERSIGDSTPSPTFSLLLEYRQQFSRSTAPQRKEPSTLSEEHFEFAKLEDEEDEVSYQMLRSRERREVDLHDYAEKYRSTTEYGQVVIEQRSKMVHWMVEQCSSMKLQDETMFLGVSLLDRFLGKGFFKSRRNLQIVGIACLTLATRIEENQPYNSVRKKNFCLGNNVYKRCEVVAMEWLVQEVLNFKCFLPTIYNFLWFYLKAARADAEMEKNAKYLAVLLLSESEQLLYWPSTVAACVVMLASLPGNKDASKRVMETHVRTSDDDLSECAKSLRWLLKYIC